MAFEKIENCICGNRNVHSRVCKSHRRDLYIKEYNHKNKTRIKQTKKEYEKTPARIKRRRKQQQQRLELDPNFHLIHKLRSHLYITLKRYSKTGKIMPSNQLGVNHKVIIEYLKPFPKDLSKYHIDHIIPLSLFDFNNLEHIKKAFAPTNHQWLTAQQNMEKNNRLVMPHYNHIF